VARMSRAAGKPGGGSVCNAVLTEDVRKCPVDVATISTRSTVASLSSCGSSSMPLVQHQTSRCHFRATLASDAVRSCCHRSGEVLQGGAEHV
jgi:hypothetical protein